MSITIEAKREVTLTRVLNANPAVVFKAWTDPQQLCEWWGSKGFSNPVCKLDLRPGGSIFIEMKGPDGTVYPMYGLFKEIHEPGKLVFSTVLLDSYGNPYFEVLNTVTLVEENGKTKLSLHALVSTATAAAEQHILSMNDGWKQCFDRLEEELERLKLAPIIIERTFKAPASMIWKALTDKDEMKNWYFDIPEFKPVEGLEFSFLAGQDEKKYLHLCKITEVVDGKKMTYSWRYDGYDGNSFVTFELFPEKNSTRLKLTHAGLDSFPAITNPDLAKENFVIGWTYIMNSLQAMLEK
jgi:uncharacterized protein YndB with AHSA1/START domain